MNIFLRTQYQLYYLNALMIFTIRNYYVSEYELLCIKLFELKLSDRQTIDSAA